MIPIFFYVNPENKIDSQSYLDELDKPLQPSSPPRHSSSHPTNHHTLDKHWPRTGLWSWATVRSNATTHTEEYNNGNPLTVSQKRRASWTQCGPNNWLRKSGSSHTDALRDVASLQRAWRHKVSNETRLMYIIRIHFSSVQRLGAERHVVLQA